MKIDRDMRDRIIQHLRRAQSEMDLAEAILKQVPRTHPLPEQIRIAGNSVELVIDHVCLWDAG